MFVKMQDSVLIIHGLLTLKYEEHYSQVQYLDRRAIVRKLVVLSWGIPLLNEEPLPLRVLPGCAQPNQSAPAISTSLPFSEAEPWEDLCLLFL